MADVVVPDPPVPEPTPLDPTVDLPDRVDDMLAWLVETGLEPEVRWAETDLAVIAASAPS